MNVQVYFELDPLANIKQVKFQIAIKDDDAFANEKIANVIDSIEMLMQSYRRSDAIDRIAKYANN